jgi:REP element-mobilizing transposase RayT
LQRWDYGFIAAYFITICTADHKHFFGDIDPGGRDAMHCVSTMQLSQIGEIVASEWIKTPGIRQDMNLGLGEFIVMPDHFHGIIIIGENEYNRGGGHCRDAMHRVSTNTNRVSTGNKKNKFGIQSKNLASIIRGFKSSVTIQSREINSDFAWQSRYYEHIIRDEESYRRISEYICNNPVNWQKDDYYGQ